jgi:hypothetical protein
VTTQVTIEVFFFGGAPHFVHAFALSLNSLPHSLQVINAMPTPFAVNTPNTMPTSDVTPTPQLDGLRFVARAPLSFALRRWGRSGQESSRAGGRAEDLMCASKALPKFLGFASSRASAWAASISALLMTAARRVS